MVDLFMDRGDPMPIMPRQECCKEGCQAPAEWQVVFMFYPPKKYGHKPARAETEISVCDEHGKDIEPDHLLGDDGWAQILHSFKLGRKRAPERSLTKLDLIPIIKL